MSMSSVFSQGKPHRGFLILEGGGVALALIFIIAFIIGGIMMLWGRKDVGLEISNIQSIISSAKGLLSGPNGYSYTSGSTMTGSLIQSKGVPTSMKIQGDVASGTATLWNTWGGQVVVAPVSLNGYNTAFSVTYPRVPQDACIAIVTRLSMGGLVSEITVNSNTYSDGKVTNEDAGKSCVKDSGMTGQNTLVFTVNG